MIELKNVSKKYGNNFYAVKDLNVTIKDGEIFGFLGPNGAGKTTTLKMMTGLSSLTNGQILINGHDISLDSVEAKKQFGFVSDNPDIFLRLKGKEYLEFIASIFKLDKEEASNKIIELSQRFELTSALNEKILSYSHGMRQKLMIIGVLLHNPSNWILDEPLTGLDPKSAFTLKEMMREHADKGNSVLFSTHVLDVAEKICDRIGIISKGKLIFVGTIEELKKSSKENQSLEELFLELIENA